MRLLNSKSIQLELLHHRNLPPYAIVSHRWGEESEEVLFTDIGDQARTRSKGKGYHKILGSCAQAERDKIDYVWLDTCCIDKSNNTELSEAINSMYKWYSKSMVCYAYLHDVSDPSKFTESDWFTRGWTLQELIAPKVIKFFAKDWVFIGTRGDLLDRIAEHTGIHPEILRTGKIPLEVTISQKMFWAAKRKTTKEEDRTYSMLGLLGVNMVPIYGIDDAAFEDLQHKIVAKYPDQTLFAWYHKVTQPEDIVMEDTGLPPCPSPGTLALAESVEANFPLMNTTGLLASSPSQYLESYEISEPDFRKNYVDGIRDHSYRSHFSISNNLVHISLPVKHMKDKIWKAVLRCSFEPPGGDQVQRPMVIYLEEIQRWKYFRLHYAPEEREEDGSDQMNDRQDIPGSLERLSDEELQLEGYVLRDIDVVARHGESPSEDQPARQLSDDPDALPKLSEDERISQLPKHPPGVKTTNIIVCGEPGVAAGRVINLIMDNTVIKPLTDYDREAMAVTPIDATLKSRNIRIFYITGPRDPYLDLDIYHTAVRHMHELVRLAKVAGGIHLLLLCMVGSKVTGAVESNYRLFHDHICRGQVPMMLIVTGLGKTRRMEDWWDKHKSDREIQAMRIIDHACITVLQGEDAEHERKFQESMKKIQQLVTDFMKHLDTEPNVYCPEDANQWFTFMGKRAMDLLLRGQKKSLKQETITEKLKEGLKLNETEANNLARQFFDEDTMEL